MRIPPAEEVPTLQQKLQAALEIVSEEVKGRTLNNIRKEYIDLEFITPLPGPTAGKEVPVKSILTSVFTATNMTRATMGKRPRGGTAYKLKQMTKKMC